MTREIVAVRTGRVVRWIGKRVFGFTPDAFCTGFVILFWVVPTSVTRVHEWRHMHQAKSLGLARWWWRYLMERRRHGYRENAFEVDARRASGDYT